MLGCLLHQWVSYDNLIVHTIAFMKLLRGCDKIGPVLLQFGFEVLLIPRSMDTQSTYFDLDLKTLRTLTNGRSTYMESLRSRHRYKGQLYVQVALQRPITLHDIQALPILASADDSCQRHSCPAEVRIFRACPAAPNVDVDPRLVVGCELDQGFLVPLRVGSLAGGGL